MRGMGEEPVIGAPSEDHPTVIARRWPPIIAAVTALVLLAGAGALAAPGVMHGRPIEGEPTANAAEVEAVRVERAAAEEAARIAAEKAALAALEDEVLDSLRRHFNDPERTWLGIDVLNIGLVRVAENRYEGLVELTADGGSPTNVKIEVHADGRTLIWELDRDDLLRLLW